MFPSEMESRLKEYRGLKSELSSYGFKITEEDSGPFGPRIILTERERKNKDLRIFIQARSYEGFLGKAESFLLGIKWGRRN